MTGTRVRGWMRLALAGGLALALAACSSTVVRTPQSDGGKSASAGRSGASVVVQQGDTLYSVSRRNGVSVEDMARWNGLKPPYTIYPGQRLALGQGGTRTGGTTAPTRTVVAPKPGAVEPAPRPATPAAAPPSSGFAWRWPAQGVVLNTFVAGNNTRQGIDIGGSSGQPVTAAADGVVVYSGAGLVGYGELIIVKHSDEWLSAYAHNRRRLVTEGTAVKGGQPIAELGRSGTSRDMLHFEVRRNGKPIDPLTVLPPP